MTSQDILGGTAHKLGAHHDGDGVNFAVFSEHATGIELCLFSPDGKSETTRIALPERTGSIWHGYVPGLPVGTLYGYRVHGEYAPDTPTVKGFEVGCDIEWWHRLGWIDADAAEHMQNRRETDVAAAGQDTDFATYIHQSLARSNAALVAVQLDDVLAVTEAQNLPGTIDEHPNWRRNYTTSVQELRKQNQLVAIASLKRDAQRTCSVRGFPNED